MRIKSWSKNCFAIACLGMMLLATNSVLMAGIDAVDASVKEIVDETLKLNISSDIAVAIPPFKSQNNRVSFLGFYVSENISGQIIKTQKLKIVDRVNIDKILEEIKFNASGVVDVENSIEIGKFTGAKYLLIGGIDAIDSKTLLLNARLIEAESAKVLATYQKTIKRDKEVDSFYLKTWSYQVVTKNGVFSFSPTNMPELPSIQDPLVSEDALINTGEFSSLMNSMDVDSLAAYDDLLKFEKGDAAPEEKYSRWLELAHKFPKYAEAASKRASEWKEFFEKINLIKTIQRKRREIRDADWKRLSRLLGVSVISDSDKQGFVDAFITTYGRNLGENPYLIQLLEYLPNSYFSKEELRDIDKHSSMAFLPGGEFLMGAEDSFARNSAPRHAVYVDEFFIDKSEISLGEYFNCVKADKCSHPTEEYLFWYDKKVNGVPWKNATKKGFREMSFGGATWFQAATYCRWAGKTLPTEAEWEYAARSAGRDILYPWGNSPSNCDFTPAATPTQACTDTRGMTEQGVCDMLGNVPEWVWDRYDETYYQNSPKENPDGPKSGSKRTVRGDGCAGKELGRSGISPTTRRSGGVPDTARAGFRCGISKPLNIILQSKPSAGN